MPVESANLVFNDTPSKYNKDLTDFLKRNIKTIIIKGQIKFKFTIAKPNNIENLRSNGITRLPVLLMKNKNPIIGVPDIINYIQNRVKNSKTTAIPKSEEEVLNDYFKNTLGSIKHDENGKIITPDDDEYNESDKLMDELNKEVKKRENVNKMSNSKPSRMQIKDDDQFNYNSHSNNKRDNNLLNVEDPISTFNTMRKNGDNDDDMMSALLEKIGSESDF